LLTIYRSNRAEVLAQLLAAQLRHPPPAPLEPVQVMVNTWPTSRWLGETLALHLGGIAAHLRFPFPGSHLRRVVRLALGEEEAAPLDEEAEIDPWRASSLVWPVLEELPPLAAAPEGEPLRLWLHQYPDPARVDAALWHLARAIADAFDDYALYRPELLLAWEEGRAVDALNQPLPPSQRWQPRLHRRLRERLGVAPFGPQVLEVVRRLRAGEGDPALLKRHLGERLRLFGPSSMAPIQVRLLQALATWLPVDLYLLTPCPGLWHRCVARRQVLRQALALRQPLDGDWLLQAPPLEARFGRLGAEFQQLLEGTGEAQLSEERDEALFLRPTVLATAAAPAGPPPAPRLLHQLQEHLLDPDPQPALQRADGDHSLEFHSCPGPLRQAQIVRDRVLQLLAADPTLEPRHILVMTPAVETFAPLVATVFSDREATGVELPWRLTDRSQEAEGGVGRTLLDLLALAGDRLTAQGLERLLESPPLRRRFGLSAEEAVELTAVLQRCGFRWGLGAEERQGDPTHTLGWAMDRLLLGLVLPEPDGAWPTDTAPAPPFPSLEQGGRSLHLLLRLRHWLEQFGRPGPCLEWVERLGEALVDLFGADPASDGELAPLRGALEEWRGVAGATDLLLEPAVVAAVLEERLTRDSGRFGHRSGSLTISALEPMRAIPHRVVILMGLDADAFPRQRQRPGFHLMDAQRQLGDPDPADQDRYALLEALLSARDHLLITWNGLEERTGVALPPATPVQQWLQWLQSVLPAEQAAALRVAHDPNPLDPSHFLPQGDRPPASCDRRQLEACRQLVASRQPRRDLPPPDPGLAAALLPQEAAPSAPEDGLPPETPAAAEPFDDLRAWLTAPQETWLRELGMAPREWEQEVDDLEPLELEERERSGLLREALEEAWREAADDAAEEAGLRGLEPGALDSAGEPGAKAEPGEEGQPGEGAQPGEEAEPGAPWLRRHRGRGRFPPAGGAVLEANRLEERWRSLQGVLAHLGEERTPLLSWGRWQARVSLRGDAVVLARPAKGRVRDQLELWLLLQLAVAALESDGPRRGLLITREAQFGQKDAFAPLLTFRAPEPEAARQELERLGRLRQEWRTTCWPVPPRAGWAWMAAGGLAYPEKAFEKATEAWEGSSHQGGGERDAPEMRLCFGSERSFRLLLEELPFAEQAALLFPPLLEAILPPERARR